MRIGIGQHSLKMGQHSPKLGQHSPKIGRPTLSMSCSQVQMTSPSLFPSPDPYRRRRCAKLYNISCVYYIQIISESYPNHIAHTQSAAIFRSFVRCLSCRNLTRGLFQILPEGVTTSQRLPILKPCFGCFWKSSNLKNLYHIPTARSWLGGEIA